MSAPSANGEIAVSQAQLSGFDFERIHVEIESVGPQLQLISRWTQRGHDVLEVETRLITERAIAAPTTVLSDEATRVRVRAEAFELGALTPLLPPSVKEIEGRLHGNLNLQGGAGEPLFTGSLSIEGGSVFVPALGKKPIEPVSATVSIENHRVQLDQVRLGAEGAGVVGTGHLEIAGGTPDGMALRLAFEGFPIDAPGLVRGTLDGPIEVSGNLQSPVVQGELALSELQLRIPEPEDRELKEIRVLAAGDEKHELREDPTVSIFDPLRLDLQVEIARQFVGAWARGRNGTSWRISRQEKTRSSASTRGRTRNRAGHLRTLCAPLPGDPR